jgi:ABC-type molybdate transport system substrate-binding protein
MMASRTDFGRKQWRPVRLFGLFAAAILAMVTLTMPAAAAEIKVLSGGAVKAAVTDLAEAWGKETGHRVTITHTAAVAAKSEVKDAAMAFIAALMAPAARPRFAAVGLDYRE